MSELLSADESTFPDFLGLQSVFAEALQQAFEAQDAQILLSAYESYPKMEYDRKSPMDHVFRELLLFDLRDDVERVGALVKLSVDAVRLDIVSVTIPVVLLGDIFDSVTLDKCERIFSFVEDMVEVWKEDIFFSSCKNNILRMCNDLLRRLSRAQNTVFCGRILLFLSKFFPFSERSGLNIVSEFNLDNVTEYGVGGKDPDDTLEDTVEEVPIKVDYNLYCKFWSLQDFFRNPNQCYSKAQWKMFQAHACAILDAFSSFKLEEPRLGSTTTAAAVVASNEDDIKPDSAALSVTLMEDDSKDKAAQMEAQAEVAVQGIFNADQFFAKYLTNPKLLALQLSDSNFRRSVLVQFLILFQYLQLTVKFKADSSTLTTAQTDFIKETEARVYCQLEETPPDGKRFACTVKHMLTREEMWNNWKNEGCREFKKPEEILVTNTSAVSSDPTASADAEAIKPPVAKRLKRTLGESLREANHSGKFFLGNDVLTRLWNHSPDNLQACKSEERNFLPQVDTYLENPREKNDPSFEWRALRLLAHQSPHFFTFLTTPAYKISDYLDSVRKKIAKDKMDAIKAATGGSSLTANNSAGSCAIESSEQEAVALQEQEAEQEADQVLEGEDDPTDLEAKAPGDDDENAHSKPVTASREHIEEIAPLIGDEWKKLGKKLGYTADELLYFETENPERDGGCITMLSNWFTDDDDASLDNWAYILEGLEINAAAKAVKALVERLMAKEEKLKAEMELLSE